MINESYMIGFILSSIVILLTFKFKRTLPNEQNVDDQDVLSHIKKYGGNHLSHLIFLHDKKVYWAQNEQVLIVYRKVANHLIVLGDPIGEETLIPHAIKEFETYCNQNGCTSVFYQVSPRFMEYDQSSPYRFFKLGEVGLVDLTTYTLAGKKGAKLRTRRNKFERKGYQFNVLQGPYSQELQSEIKRVSDSWLQGRKEKGFSVSFYSKDYISRFPLAVLTDQNGKMVAFATLACDHHPQQKTVTIDLMRNHSNSPHGTMDVLFTSIFSWAQENDYQFCSLGMAPLANVGQAENSTKSEKAAHFVYLNGDSFYKFKGLKEYKSKFAHLWEPKYLAYKKAFLPLVILYIIIAITVKPSQTTKKRNKIYYRKRKVG